MTTRLLEWIPMTGRGRLLVAIVFSGFIFIAFFQPAFSQRADPRREPATAIAEAVRLLERSDHVGFLKTFMRPDELKEMLAKYKTIEDVANEFGRDDRPAKMLDVLKAASTLTPTMNAEGTRADYRFEKPVGGARRLSLTKIGDYWYIRD